MLIADNSYTLITIHVGRDAGAPALTVRLCFLVVLLYLCSVSTLKQCVSSFQSHVSCGLYANYFSDNRRRQLYGG